jgi:tripartite-type tricarboxylate transporter receptor subunit TctC
MGGIMQSGRVAAILRSVFTVLLAMGLGHPAYAQTYPNKPITFIWPSTPGSNEAVFRLMLAEAAKTLGQPIVTEVRAGAGGRLGVAAVMKSPGDGYLITGVVDSILTVVPQLSESFKPELGKDYTPIHQTFSVYYALIAHPSVQFRDVVGMVAYAKANPRKLNIGAGGTAGELYAAVLMAAAGIDLTVIPYKGSQQTLVDVLSGTLHLSLGLPSASWSSQVELGKLVAIASTGPQRMRQYPNAPTLQESGVPATLQTWFGVVGPPGIPAEVAAKLSGAINAALKNPDIQKRFNDNGNEIIFSSPQEFSARIKSESESLAPIARRLGFKVD